jgi:cell division protein FtsL
MSIDVEYAIKKDVRNNPVVREVDVEQKRDFMRTTYLAALIVALVLFSAWQHFQIIDTGYAVQRLEAARAAEESANRQLRLEYETLRTPQRIEHIALHDLHMVAPTSKDTLIIERAKPAASASQAIVALTPGPAVR